MSRFILRLLTVSLNGRSPNIRGSSLGFATVGESAGGTIGTANLEEDEWAGEGVVRGGMEATMTSVGGDGVALRTVTLIRSQCGARRRRLCGAEWRYNPRRRFPRNETCDVLTSAEVSSTSLPTNAHSSSQLRHPSPRLRTIHRSPGRPGPPQPQSRERARTPASSPHLTFTLHNQ